MTRCCNFVLISSVTLIANCSNLKNHYKEFLVFSSYAGSPCALLSTESIVLMASTDTFQSLFSRNLLIEQTQLCSYFNSLGKKYIEKLQDPYVYINIE